MHPDESPVPRPTTYEGQLGLADLRAILHSNREAAAEARAAFLLSHPDYVPCSIAGCQGLVAPAFRRTVNSKPWNLCPRRSAHARLFPTLFGSSRSR
jgi:hypothetical protein